MDTTKKSEHVKWVASQYMDTHEWGILSEHNDIVVGLSSRLTKELVRQIVHEHNTFAALLEALKLVVSDEECYCASHELKGPCDYCIARAVIAAAEKEEG